MKLKQEGSLPFLRLGLLTVAALWIHGYHLGVEDGEIYVPATRKLLNPALYPYATEFFLSHGHLSLFSTLLAMTARLSGMSMDWTIFFWYVATLFGMLLACWMLARACFSSIMACWSSVVVMTAVLTMPATNTALLLMDPYLTARSFSTPLTLLTLAFYLERRYLWTFAALLTVAAIHPQMVVYLGFLIAVLWMTNRSVKQTASPVPALASFGSIGIGLPTGFHLSAAEGPYKEALYSRDYFFLANWSWYHWLGLLAPLAILASFWRGVPRGTSLRGTKDAFRKLSFAMLPFGLVSIAIGLLFATTHDFDMFARLQPLRCFHLITLVFVLLLSGVIGEYAVKGRPWLLAVIAVPLAVGLFFVGRDTYPNSPPVEFPAEASSNAWVDTLLWVRRNTPTDAVFAVDSRYFKDSDTDLHGFRAIAERSALADYYKDGGVVSLFPALATEWKDMSDATYGLNQFNKGDFLRLQQHYPRVSWTVLHGKAPVGLECPYQRRGFSVCRFGIPTAAAVDRQ